MSSDSRSFFAAQPSHKLRRHVWRDSVLGVGFQTARGSHNDFASAHGDQEPGAVKSADSHVREFRGWGSGGQGCPRSEGRFINKWPEIIFKILGCVSQVFRFPSVEQASVAASVVRANRRANSKRLAIMRHDPKGLQMNSNRKTKTVERSGPRWPFQRHSAAWLPTLALYLLGCLLTARGQDPFLTSLVYPVNTNVNLGATVSFQVFANSTNGPMTYQWQHEGTNLPAATNSLLAITNVSVADAGGYKVTVWNASGAFTNSRTAILMVDTTFTKITQGPLVEDREPSVSGAWGDYDNDNRLDLFVPNTGGSYRNSLYRNLGGDEFIRVTNALTLANPGRSWGAQWGDVDNDGDLDVFILRPFSESGFPNNQARNEMFRNEGGGVFTPMTNAATSVAGFWTDATWVDIDGDGWLDLFATTQSFAAGQLLDDFLWRNLTDGRFVALTTNEVGVVLKPQSKTVGPAWCDIDGDGDLDLYVSKYGGTTNFLYRNDGGQLIPVTAGSLPARRSTWAAAWADFNNDGLFDLFTGGENGTNMLHLNRGNWVFEDVTVASGLALSGNVYTVAVGDFDNDGDLDLYVPVYDAADVLYVNRGDATFDRMNVGSPLTEGSRDGATWVDYNNDGFLDLFKACGDGTPTLNLLYRNSLPQYGNTNHWLKLRLKGTASNASAIGARVRARAVIGGKDTWQVRQITAACVTAAATDGMRVHFGLGDATNVTTLRIEWPSGIVQEIQNVAGNQFLTVVESQGYTNAPPQFSEVTNSTGGLQLSFIEPVAGARYVLEASTDLVNWTKLLARTSAGGIAQFIDTRATNYTRRFYRLQVP